MASPIGTENSIYLHKGQWWRAQDDGCLWADINCFSNFAWQKKTICVKPLRVCDDFFKLTTFVPRDSKGAMFIYTLF